MVVVQVSGGVRDRGALVVGDRDAHHRRRGRAVVALDVGVFGRVRRGRSGQGDRGAEGGVGLRDRGAEGLDDLRQVVDRGVVERARRSGLRHGVGDARVDGDDVGHRAEHGPRGAGREVHDGAEHRPGAVRGPVGRRSDEDERGPGQVAGRALRGVQVARRDRVVDRVAVAHDQLVPADVEGEVVLVTVRRVLVRPGRGRNKQRAEARQRHQHPGTDLRYTSRVGLPPRVAAR